MSTINNVNNDYIVQPNNIQKESNPNELAASDFMELMLMQMQNQNPMDPVENTEYIAQMAEFTALEQMQSMSSSLNTMYAFGLMGKEVTLDNGDGTTTSGVVESVSIKNGTNYIEVNGNTYNSSSVILATNKSEEVDNQ